MRKPEIHTGGTGMLEEKGTEAGLHLIGEIAKGYSNVAVVRRIV